MITAGPTREPIDTVRYISNRSEGKIGYELAAEMLMQGARVFLVSGPVNVDLTHPMLTVVKVNTACEMYLACCKFFEEADITLFAAAVSDYRLKEISDKKIIKQEDYFTIKMVKNIDIAGAFAKLKRPNQLTVGFTMQTTDDIKQAMLKMDTKNFDMVVLNSVNEDEPGFGNDLNRISIIKNDYSIRQLALKSQSAIVKELVASIAQMLQQKQFAAFQGHEIETSDQSSLIADSGFN